ncbi:hypothetical protein Ciccas_006763 [Cichlidogyrus casuarinus]|uniref:Uncharacterized protein n=1 Tax=Cichlidogyrus casuarinus TaxID=1844966 RepID=A0ABD2Q4W4_9PLAT
MDYLHSQVTSENEASSRLEMVNVSSDLRNFIFMNASSNSSNSPRSVLSLENPVPNPNKPPLQRKGSVVRGNRSATPRRIQINGPSENGPHSRFTRPGKQKPILPCLGLISN